MPLWRINFLNISYVAVKYNKEVLFDVSFLTDIALHLNDNDKPLSASTAMLRFMALQHCCVAISFST